MYEDDGTAVLMDFGSMGPAKVSINGTSQATAMQVSWLALLMLNISFIFNYEYHSCKYFADL